MRISITGEGSKEAQRPERCTEYLPNCALMAGIHGNGQPAPPVPQSRTHWKLAAASENTSRNAALLRCSRA